MMKISLFPYFVIELVCVVLYISKYGILNFFGEVFLSGIFGFFLVLSYGFSNFYSKFENLNLKNVFGSMGLVVGGFLLMVPGILSDIFAVFIISISLILKLISYLQTPTHEEYCTKEDYKDDVIDVEIIDETKRG